MHWTYILTNTNHSSLNKLWLLPLGVRTADFLSWLSWSCDLEQRRGRKVFQVEGTAWVRFQRLCNLAFILQATEGPWKCQVQKEFSKHEMGSSIEGKINQRPGDHNRNPLQALLLPNRQSLMSQNNYFLKDLSWLIVPPLLWLYFLFFFYLLLTLLQPHWTACCFLNKFLEQRCSCLRDFVLAVPSVWNGSSTR